FVGLWMGRITALFLVGAAAGGLGFGWLGDRLGRVRAMTLSILTYSVFTGLCFFARDPWQLGALRFTAAFGMGGEWSLGVALVMEAWPSRNRALLAGIIGTASNAGYLLIALVGLGIQLAVPESERWKAAVRRGAARPVREILSSGLLVKTLLGIALASVALIGTWGSVQWLPLWADQMTGGRVPSAKAMTQILVSAGAIIGSLAGALAAGRMGRRPAYFGLCLLSLLSCGGLF